MDCTPKCRSKSHAHQLNAVIQSGTLEQAKAFLSTCQNAYRGQDFSGRNVLHVAASAGKYDLIVWLLEQAKGSLNTKDKESGWTALHRAVFYGQIACAVLLIKRGATLTTKDNESLTAVDLSTRDHLYMPFVQTNKEIGVYNVYTWGDNSSYTLGHGKESRTATPEILETFRRKQITISKVLMRRYHSVYLTSDGAVYACGHGRGGRLGLGHEEPTLYPVPMKLPQVQISAASGDAVGVTSSHEASSLRVVDIAAGRDHTLLLGSNGRVYSCGMNDHRQLGIYPEPAGKITEPKLINSKVLMKGAPISHIAAARYHSVVATDTHVYTFGLNAGQLGHAKTEKHCSPRVVSVLNNHPESRVQMIECCDSATVVVMKAEKREGFYILYNYATKYVSFRGAKFDKRIICMSISGGMLDYTQLPELLNWKGASPLRVYWTNHIGQMFLWTEDNGGLVRKITYSSLGRQLSVLHISASLSELIITSEEGGAYIITPPQSSSPPAESMKSRVSAAVPHIDMKIRRIPGVHRATQCSVDYKSTNYSILQAKEYTCFFAEIDDTHIREDYKYLLKSSPQYDNSSDGVTDIIITCYGEKFACHKYILSSRSSYFSKLIAELDKSTNHPDPEDQGNTEEGGDGGDDPDDMYRNLPGFYPPSQQSQSLMELNIDCDLKTLQFILQYIYTNVIDTEILFGHTGTGSATAASSSKSKKKQTQEKEKLAKQKQREKLQEITRKYSIKALSTNRSPSMTFNMNKFPQWCDVIVTSSDGAEVKCHKCVLVARMEYFRTMLTGHWYEGQDRLVRVDLPIPCDILNAVLVYVYTDQYDHINTHDIEFAVNVMVVADQLLMSRLKQICESLIVSQLTIDNVTQVYQLASTYNTLQLKDAAMFMMCMNMSEMLELSYLDELEMELLEELSIYYRTKLSCMARRRLYPIRDGLSDTEIALVLSEYKATGDVGDGSVPVVDAGGSSRRQRRSRTRTTSNSSIDSDVSKQSSNRDRTSISELTVDVDDFTEEFTEEFSEKFDEELCMSDKRVTQKTPESPHHKESTITSPRGVNISNSHQAVTSNSPNTSDNSPRSSTSTTHTNPSLRDIMADESEAKNKSLKQQAASTSSSKKGKTKYRSLDSVERNVSDSASANNNSTPLGSTSAAISQPWGSTPTPTVSADQSVMSLKDVMAKEQAARITNRQASELKYPPASTGRKKTRWITPSQIETPDKPIVAAWNIPPSPTTFPPSPQYSAARTISTSNGNIRHTVTTSNGITRHTDSRSAMEQQQQRHTGAANLHAIMSQEADEMEALHRYSNKPLSAVQIEERAIEELLARYRATAKSYETITVERVSVRPARPLWTQKTGS